MSSSLTMTRYLLVLAALAAACAVATASDRTRYVPLNFYEIAQHYKQSVSLLNGMRHEPMSAFYSWINLNLESGLPSFAASHSDTINSLIGKDGGFKADAPFPLPNVTSSCALQLAEFLGALTTNQFWALQHLES